MKIPFFLLCLVLPAAAQWDEALLQQSRDWKTGEPPPARLLRFPDGHLSPPTGCGMEVAGSRVGDYVVRIGNPELLAALLLDPLATSETVREASARLIGLKGTRPVAALLAGYKDASERPELAVLAQLLRSPFATIRVAEITATDMEETAAERALEGMRADLESGTEWAEAYRKISELHPDPRTPGSTRITYLYEGVVAPTGFDIQRYRIATALPVAHLQEVFRRQRGTVVLKAKEGVFLYHVLRFEGEGG